MNTTTVTTTPWSDSIDRITRCLAANGHQPDSVAAMITAVNTGDRDTQWDAIATLVEAAYFARR